MDSRRPVRPPPTSRRAVFHPSTSQSRRNNPLNTNAHPKPSVHIASEEPIPADDLVERDSAGNYKTMGPTTAMKIGVTGGMKGEAEEQDEQERQMIGLYGKENGHWDQAAIMDEVKTALRSSLEKKVQSLENDRWMFEGEGKGKF
ncbi:hypothetical protein DM02DRAFT_608770 [Periconia macrospinosa]|uniref:Uncharacterized protein n=1 Tax=Periconia macrospinosa TaxID=97972 RepID=A0A2V1EAM7_9PLEO|nr:hypothetical protein DM02DRAFT_608770 [Periconia macrospinosa]